MHIIDLKCIGEEDNLWKCSHFTLLEYNCTSNYDALVVCQGSYKKMLYPLS